MRDEFMMKRGGKQYVLYAGLLEEGHARGLKGIDTDLVQIPTVENGNVAVVKAKIELEDGRTFCGIGDASPENVGRAVVPHIIRQAETRAKARALRDAVNVGATAVDELVDGAEAEAASNNEPGAERPRARSGGPRGSRGGAGGENGAGAASQRHVRAVEDPPEEPAGHRDAAGEEPPSSGEDRPVLGRNQKAAKSQLDLLRTLAVELRGDAGVQRLESSIGKRLDELTKGEATEWIDRLTPSEGTG